MQKVKSVPLYGILLSSEGPLGSEPAEANVCTRGFCWIVSPINGGGSCRGSGCSVQVCPPPHKPGEGELCQLSRESYKLLRWTEDFKRFSLAQGVCAAPVTSAVSF